MFTKLHNWIARRSPEYRELKGRNINNEYLVREYAGALRDIVNTIEGTKAPNGTLRRCLRLSRLAFDRAIAS